MINKHQMNYVIVDLEATCWESDQSTEDMEIIEIGAVLLKGNTFQSFSDFDQFVKPIINPYLSDFCMQLTNITQRQVDEALIYKKAFQSFLVWIGEEPFKLCSWGKFDFDLFVLENKRVNIGFPENFMGHINLKELYARAFNTKPNIGLKKALQKQSMVFHGNPHRGIDDARNTARIAQMILVLDY